MTVQALVLRLVMASPDKDKIEKAFHDLEKVGMDRITAAYCAREMRKNILDGMERKQDAKGDTQ